MLRTSRLIILAIITLPPARTIQAQAPGIVAGRVSDQATGQPIADARVAFRPAADSSGADRPPVDTYTDGGGRFQIAAHPGHRYIVSVWHLGYGLHQNALLIPPTGQTSLEIFLSETAIRLAPVTVDAAPVAEAAERGARSPGVADRAEIAEAARSGTSLLDFLTRRFSGLYLQRSGQIGAAPCVQFRLARVAGICRPPLVRLDRTTISGATALEFLASFPLAQLQRIEVVPLSAGSESGQGIEGTILLESEGGPPGAETAMPSRRGEVQLSYDWRREAGRYPWARVYAASFLGNAAGLAAGLAILGQCADLAAYRPRYDPGDGRYFDGTTWHSRPDIRCSPGLWLVTGLSAVALPALGGSLGGRLAGSTEQSNGLMTYSAVASQAVFIPAMALIITTDHPAGPLTPAEVTAFALATIGAPLLNTLADRFLRVLR